MLTLTGCCKGEYPYSQNYVLSLSSADPCYLVASRAYKPLVACMYLICKRYIVLNALS